MGNDLCLETPSNKGSIENQPQLRLNSETYRFLPYKLDTPHSVFRVML